MRSRTRQRPVRLIRHLVVVGVREGRRVGRRDHPVHADVRAADVSAGDRVAVAFGVGVPVGRAREHRGPWTRPVPESREGPLEASSPPASRRAPRRTGPAASRRTAGDRRRCRTNGPPVFLPRWLAARPGMVRGVPGVTAAIVGLGVGLRQSVGRPAVRRRTQTGWKGARGGPRSEQHVDQDDLGHYRRVSFDRDQRLVPDLGRIARGHPLVVHGRIALDHVEVDAAAVARAGARPRRRG